VIRTYLQHAAALHVKALSTVSTTPYFCTKVCWPQAWSSDGLSGGFMHESRSIPLSLWLSANCYWGEGGACHCRVPNSRYLLGRLGRRRAKGGRVPGARGFVRATLLSWKSFGTKVGICIIFLIGFALLRLQCGVWREDGFWLCSALPIAVFGSMGKGSVTGNARSRRRSTPVEITAFHNDHCIKQGADETIAFPDCPSLRLMGLDLDEVCEAVCPASTTCECRSGVMSRFLGVAWCSPTAR
jgi:hypothetical protein